MSFLDPMARRMVRRIGTARNARLRRPPRLGPVQQTGEVKVRAVYYLCPDLNVPTGGIRSIYRHVDTLNAAGIRAAVVHARPGFACSWFDHQTAVTSAESVALTPADVLVVPEFYAGRLDEMPSGLPLVVFNQNAYRMFDAAQPVLGQASGLDMDRVTAMMVVSHDNAEYANYAFPGLHVERVRIIVDGQMFHPAGTAPGRRIAVMPRRRRSDCHQVLGLLALRGCLDGWETVIIDGRPEKETAELLRSCAIFLSFSEQEGFGMPPAEAMACGCYVVGFTGLAGREYFDPATSTPVEEGDVLAFAQAAERALRAFDEDAGSLRQRALTASARILKDYSAEGQRADLLSFFRSLNDHPA
jgi:glycosyltransferase involved in cell wall biosynthesis